MKRFAVSSQFFLLTFAKSYNIHRVYMNFSTNVERLINDYSKPMTKPDWRNGSYISIHSLGKCNNHIKCIGGGYCINILFNEMLLSMGQMYGNKLIPDGRSEFNEDHFLSAYEAYYLDKSEWE